MHFSHPSFFLDWERAPFRSEAILHCVLPQTAAQTCLQGRAVKVSCQHLDPTIEAARRAKGFEECESCKTIIKIAFFLLTAYLV